MQLGVHGGRSGLHSRNHACSTDTGRVGVCEGESVSLEAGSCGAGGGGGGVGGLSNGYCFLCEIAGLVRHERGGGRKCYYGQERRTWAHSQLNPPKATPP